jgi:hypothetical protein
MVALSYAGIYARRAVWLSMLFEAPGGRSYPMADKTNDNNTLYGLDGFWRLMGNRPVSAAVCIALCSAVTLGLPSNAAPLPNPLAAYNPHTPFITLAQSGGAKILARDVQGPAGLPVSMGISVNHNDTNGYAFLMFRGLPEGFAFSTGFQVKQSWVVSLRDLQNLKLVPPAGYQGQVELRVLLVRGQDETVESQTIVASFGNAPAEIARVEPKVDEAPVVAPSQQILTSAASSPAPEEEEGRSAKPPSAGAETLLEASIPDELQITRDQEQSLLQRAAQLVAVGEIASARLMFEHLARQGSGLSALALAKTFDPIYFRSMKTLGGLSADPEKARIWYGVAAQLGQEEAEDRLSALVGN